MPIDLLLEFFFCFLLHGLPQAGNPGTELHRGEVRGRHGGGHPFHPAQAAVQQHKWLKQGEQEGVQHSQLGNAETEQQ